MYVNTHFSVFSWPLLHNGNIHRKHVKLVLWCIIKKTETEGNSTWSYVGWNHNLFKPSSTFCRLEERCWNVYNFIASRIILLQNDSPLDRKHLWHSLWVFEGRLLVRGFVRPFTTYRSYCHHSQVVNLTANWSIKLHSLQHPLLALTKLEINQR